MARIDGRLETGNQGVGGLVRLLGRGIIRAGMADQRSVLKEFRFLDEKRRTQGLSREEQARLDGLRELVGETPPAGARTGFDVNAAAARLRESLLPAGLRNRPPPPPPEELQPEPLAFEEPAPDLLPPGDPIADLLFDPASLATDEAPQSLDASAWDAGFAEQPFDPAAAAWDPNAAVNDPNAAAAWDPNDPNAPAAWDPNAPGVWDPNDPNQPAWNPNDPNAQAWEAGAAGSDPNAPYDPAAAASWDPNAAPADPDAAAWDPNADLAVQGWDPATGTWDPNAVPQDASARDPNAVAQDPAAWDPNAVAQDPSAWDPNAVAQDPSVWDPNAVPQDPAAWDPNAVAQDPSAWDPNAVAQDPSAWDPNAVPQDPSAWDPNAVPQDAAAWDASAEFDPATLAVDPSALPDAPESPPAGWPDPAAEAGFDPSAPDALPPLELGPVETAALGAYDELAPANAAFDDAALEALLPFDPAAASAIGPNDFSAFDAPSGEGFLSAPRGRGEYDDTAGFSTSRSAWPDPPPAVPEPNAFETAPQLTSEASAEWHPESALESGFELASHGSFDAPDTAAEAAIPATHDPLDLAADPSFDAPAAVTAPSLETFDAAVEPDAPEASVEWSFDASPEPSREPVVDVELPALDFDDDAVPEPTIAHSLTIDAPPVPETAVAAVAPVDPELPTIDGEDILEELPGEEQEPLAAAGASLDFDLGEVTAPLPDFAVEAPREPPAPSPTRLAGSHRVVVHTVEGHVKRGVIEDVDLGAPSFPLAAQPDAGAEAIATDQVKAIFFMLAPGERPPAADGQRVRVTFRDGRQVAGFSRDYAAGAAGFFMVPADTRTNTGRIWVYASAVKMVAVG
jgi:hypothetical protein